MGQDVRQLTRLGSRPPRGRQLGRTTERGVAMMNLALADGLLAAPYVEARLGQHA